MINVKEKNPTLEIIKGNILLYSFLTFFYYTYTIMPH